MNLIPSAVIEKLRELLNIFTSVKFKGSNYKEGLLELAETDEEKADLQELFQNTDDHYSEKEKIKKSGLRPSEYLKNMYINSWKEEHPNASHQEIREAERQYEDILADGVIQELNALELDVSDQEIIIPDITEEEDNNNA